MTRGGALALLRTMVATMGHDNGTAGAALSGVIVVGALAILLYCFLRLIKRPVHLGFCLLYTSDAADDVYQV